MPIQKDLSGSPYYDDFNEDKNFHKILFKPTVSVQTRELNQLQTILQSQVERFGDNIFKQGTIIDGCNFSYHAGIPFVKIKDIETDGTRAIVDRYKGFRVKNSANLIAEIIDVAPGFEATTNKNTLFVNYTNSGDTLDVMTFSADDVLTIYNPEGTVESIDVHDGSIGFSNNDDVIILSSIEVTNTTGGKDFATGFTTGDILTNTVVANVEVVSVDTTSSSNGVILGIKPLGVDLAHSSSNTEWWSFTTGDDILSSASETGKVSRIIGSDAVATMVTTGVGSISTINVLGGGSGYEVPPSVSIHSRTATSGQINNLDLEAQTFIARIAVTPQSSVPTGKGYAVSIDQGIVYQKGFFIRVDPQLLIVSRYDQPDNIIVGFQTEEEIINSNIDTSLLDNVIGRPNETAPGADRLKLTTRLIAVERSEAESDPSFLAIIEFSGGEPYQQRKQTQYNIINDEISRRLYEESGNFVLDRFILNTKSPTNFADEATLINAVIDPGTAYINGHRVSTDANFNLPITKGLDTISTPVTASLNYGNYIRIMEVGGSFNFKTGDRISLHNGPNQYLRLQPGTPVTSPVADVIGYARLRSVTHESGVPGTRAAVYRVYLFDIQMNSGKNFNDVRSIFYNGTIKAVGDTVLVPDATTGKDINRLYESAKNSLVFNNGVTATKSLSDESYVYRTVDHALNANQSGYIVFNTGVDETFPYPAGTLSTNQERDLLVIPTANGVSAANIGGSVQVFSVNTSFVGTNTSFINDLTPGDWVRVANNSANVVVQIASVGNNTFATLTANASANMTSNAAIYFPMNVPISLEDMNRTASVSASANQMTISLGRSIVSDMPVSVAYNVKTEGSQVDKTVQRNKFVRLDLANNIGNTVGPWALGVPDIFRLNGVYMVDSSPQTLSINAVSSVLSNADFVVVPGHEFSNGDTVRYIGGTYTIPGLANNTDYFVFNSNTTGFQLSSNNTTPLAINASATNDISHTFTGRPYFFGPETNGVEDVTNDFYIDHNQNENYYNTSYLYTIPNPSITLSNSSVLLVKFDAFTHSADSGLKHIESYNIDDGLTLEQSNSTINTLEIPQFYSTKDEYYDLRDSIDVRPHVIATANLNATSLRTYSINPTEPTGPNKFSLTDKKFPAPESSFAADAEYYIGRTDRVIVDKNGNMRTIRGEPGTDRISAEPENAITINVLRIPPYPSYPLALSNETIKFADTKIANEKYLFKRLTDYRVQTQFKSNDIRDEQPRVYRMSDIGSLERRISDLEYYVALTLAETQVTNKVIPSSIDSSLERFKYGFFVDSFSNDVYADLDHPEYNATVVNGDLVPRYHEMNLEFKINAANSSVSSLMAGTAICLPYEEYTLINQSVATDGAVVVTPPPPVISDPNPTPTPTPVPVCNQQLVKVDISNRSSASHPNGMVWEDWAFTFSSKAYSPVELFMNCEYADTAVVIYQTKTPVERNFTNADILTTSQYATPNIANTPAVLPGGKAYKVGGRESWSNGPGFKAGNMSVAGGLWIESSYRMSWNHDPSKGNYYTVRVYKGGINSFANGVVVNLSTQNKFGQYAFRLWYPVCKEAYTPPVVEQPTNFQYNGVLALQNSKQPILATSSSLPKNTWPVAKIINVRLPNRQGGFNVVERVQQQSVVANMLGYQIKVTGLRPDTAHKIYIDWEDMTGNTLLSITGNTSAWIKGFPDSVTPGTIPSDASGQIIGTVYIPNPRPSSLLSLFNKQTANLNKQPTILVCSHDVTPSHLAINKNIYKTAMSWALRVVDISSWNSLPHLNNP